MNSFGIQTNPNSCMEANKTDNRLENAKKKTSVGCILGTQT